MRIFKAIIDIGSLKTKLTIFDTTKKEVVLSESFLTLLGKDISDESTVKQEPIDRLAKSLKKIKDILKNKEITNITIIGTEALRKATNKNKVEQLVHKYFPGHTLEIIDQQTEADLFFKAVSREFPDQDILAIDIGGGSVQLIYGRYNSKNKTTNIQERHNLKTGTYRLQQQFSPNNDSVSENFAAAKKVVAEAYKNISAPAITLVFGSSCMLDFIVATGLPTIQGEAGEKHPLRVEQKHIEELLNKLADLAPSARSHFYPQDTYFMFGADYLLLNLLEATKRVQPTHIYPTNLNSSYGFI